MSDDSQEELLAWARAEIGRLRSIPRANQAERLDMQHALAAHPEAAGAIEFLRRHAPGTEFVRAAARVVESQHFSATIAIVRVAEALERWVSFVEQGMAEVPALPVQTRVEAATDLMEQVQQLLNERTVHAAAPVVLAGAALEEFLRSRIEALGLTVTGKHSINTYKDMLTAAGDLTRQDGKDITAWAGQRNDAAHGHFDGLSRERAQNMVDGINLFMRQKALPFLP